MASLRKLRLYAAACCRRIWPLISQERLRDAIEAIELDPSMVFSDRVKAAARGPIFDLQLASLADEEIELCNPAVIRSESGVLHAKANYAAAMAAWKLMADDADESGETFDLSLERMSREVTQLAFDAAKFEAHSNGTSGSCG